MTVRLSHCPICGDILNTAPGLGDGIIVEDDMKCVRCEMVWRIEYPPFEHYAEVHILGFKVPRPVGAGA